MRLPTVTGAQTRWSFSCKKVCLGGLSHALVCFSAHVSLSVFVPLIFVLVTISFVTGSSSLYPYFSCSFSLFFLSTLFSLSTSLSGCCSLLLVDLSSLVRSFLCPCRLFLSCVHSRRRSLCLSVWLLLSILVGIVFVSAALVAPASHYRYVQKESSLSKKTARESVTGYFKQGLSWLLKSNSCNELPLCSLNS